MNTFARLVAWQRSGGGAAAPWRDAHATLPPDLLDVLRVANGDERALAVAISITGETTRTLQAVALRFIREVLLAADASHYRKLGVEADAPIARIRKHYRELIAIFHPDRLHDDAPAGDAERATIVNEAYNVLKRPHARALYDRAAAPPAQATARTGASPAATAAPAAAPAAQGVAKARNAGRRVARRWKVERDPGAIRVWMQSRSPETLKRMTIGALMVVAASVLLIAGGRDAATLALTTAPGAAADAATSAATVDPSRESRLADLVAAVPAQAWRGPSSDRPRGEPASHDLAGDPATRIRAAVDTAPPQIPARAEPHPSDPAPNSSHGAIAVLATVERSAPAPASASEYPPKGAQRAATSGDVIRDPIARVALVATSVPGGADSAVASVAAGEAPTTGERGVPPGVAPADRSGTTGAEHTRPAEAAAPRGGPSGIEVDAIVARFAAAYDRGDLGALLALIDPDAVQDDRIAFTLANFGRVFRETTSRRIELRVIQRTQEQDQARIALAVKSTFASDASSSRVAAGEMTLVVRMRAGVPVLTDVRFRDGHGHG